MEDAQKAPVRVAYDRRNRDLDPQLVWRGKDEQDELDLVVAAPPLYIQEKVHPKVLIEDLRRETRVRAKQSPGAAFDLFADFNGYPDQEAATEFYQHDINWNNRMILGDSLCVMASLAEREGLRGQVQCIYFDPPYGIKFNSNFQWSTTSRDVKDGNRDHITREPEQVKAFRDTWRDGIHSYLTYLRDRLTVARDLLADSGSIFVQIGQDNVHRLRCLMDEVFGEQNLVVEILIKKKGSQKSSMIDPVNDYVLWYSRTPRENNLLKFRTLFEGREIDAETLDEFSRIELPSGDLINLKDYVDDSGEKLDFRMYPKRVFQEFPGGRLFRPWPITNGGERIAQMAPVQLDGELVCPPKGRCWSHTSKESDGGMTGMERNHAAGRLIKSRKSIDFKRYLDDFPYKTIANWWDGFGGASDQVYVVQTNERIVERCILMATDPGDLVLDPTCGSGTTAYVAEQWGRRWITIDTSRVSMALARARIMGARYPYYLLADSPEGQRKEGELTRTPPKDTSTYGNIRQGFVYRRCSYITSGAIANNPDIDVIWDKWQAVLEPLRAELNAALGKAWAEWEVPRDITDIVGAPGGFQKAVFAVSPSQIRQTHAEWWDARIARQKEIDASIAAKAEFEYLYDRPYTDSGKVRVAGPFTVESLSPHRVLAFDADDGLIDPVEVAESKRRAAERDGGDFAAMILENLKAAGVQQAHKENRIAFTALSGWPGDFICAEGTFLEGDKQRRAGIFIGPEFGTLSRPDLVAAAREAGDAGFDVLIACAFNYDAHSAEFDKLGRIPVLKARMNPDLHMGGDLKTTGSGNLFVVFGEPDIDITTLADGQIQVRIKGVDVFHPSTGEIQSGGPDTIAVWFIDTDYNEESFFVRHAYFLGANDPYKALKTTLKAEIDKEAWDSLNSDTSRPFDKPKSGRIAVKVINHLGDEVMKVFSVG